jgi:hypothetical protein
MRLSSRYDVEAPMDRVFAELVNIDQWERAAMRRGADVTRTDRLTMTGMAEGMAEAMTWAAKFRYRGKDRNAVLRIDRLEAPVKLGLALTSSLVDAGLAFDLMELSLRRTRLTLTLDLRPKTLAARLYVQSLRLAKGRVDKAFQTRVSQFVLELEDRIRKR